MIPTVFDNLSAEAVGTFLNGVHVLKSALNSKLDLLGIVGTLTFQQGTLVNREQQAKNIAVEQAKRTWGANHYFFTRHIPRRAAIAVAAGTSLAYSDDDTVRRWFDELGKEAIERLNLDLAKYRVSQSRPNGRTGQDATAFQQPGAGA